MQPTAVGFLQLPLHLWVQMNQTTRRHVAVCGHEDVSAENTTKKRSSDRGNGALVVDE